MKYISIRDIQKYFYFNNVLGEGSFGQVWHASVIKIPFKGIRLGIPVAIKIIKNRENAEREVELMVHISSEHNVRYYGCLHVGEMYYLIMEYIPDFDLISNRSKIDDLPLVTQLEEKKNIATQIALGIIELHNVGIAHIDLKLENVLYDRETRRVKITDYSLSCLRIASAVAAGAGGDARLKRIGNCGGKLGTRYTRDPQYVQVPTSDSYHNDLYKTDWWSYGVMILDLYTGYVPKISNRDTKGIMEHKMDLFFGNIYELLTHIGVIDNNIRYTILKHTVPGYILQILKHTINIHLKPAERWNGKDIIECLTGSPAVIYNIASILPRETCLEFTDEHKIEAEKRRADKIAAKARRIEAEAEAKRKAEAEAKRKAEAEAEEKRIAEAIEPIDLETPIPVLEEHCLHKNLLEAAAKINIPAFEMGLLRIFYGITQNNLAGRFHLEIIPEKICADSIKIGDEYKLIYRILNSDLSVDFNPQKDGRPENLGGLHKNRFTLYTPYEALYLLLPRGTNPKEEFINNPVLVEGRKALGYRVLLEGLPNIEPGTLYRDLLQKVDVYSLGMILSVLKRQNPALLDTFPIDPIRPAGMTDINYVTRWNSAEAFMYYYNYLFNKYTDDWSKQYLIKFFNGMQKLFGIHNYVPPKPAEKMEDQDFGS